MHHARARVRLVTRRAAPTARRALGDEGVFARGETVGTQRNVDRARWPYGAPEALLAELRLGRAVLAGDEAAIRLRVVVRLEPVVLLARAIAASSADVSSRVLFGAEGHYAATASGARTFARMRASASSGQTLFPINRTLAALLFAALRS